MAALQKFKLLATQCGVAQSPTRSPTTSPVVNFRRKKSTLRMLLSGRRSPRREEPSPMSILPAKKRDSLSLKDLFVSSPPFQAEENKRKLNGEMIAGTCEVYRMRVNGLGGEVAGSPRPGWIGFRHRSLVRRAWRPMLLGVPENDDESNLID